jgi:hypothetical protein
MANKKRSGKSAVNRTASDSTHGACWRISMRPTDKVKANIIAADLARQVRNAVKEQVIY